VGSRIRSSIQDVENDFKLLIVLLFDRCELLGKLLVCREDLAQSHECWHDGNIHSDRTFAENRA